MRGWPEPEKVGTFQRNLERNLGVTQLGNAAPSKQPSRAATSRSLGRDAASAGSAGWLLQQPRDGTSFWRCGERGGSTARGAALQGAGWS